MSFQDQKNQISQATLQNSFESKEKENNRFLLERIINQLRPGQKSLAEWERGEMAVSAVPGAGKSHSLSVAAAINIAKNKLNQHSYLIIVTYTRSAAANIKIKIQDQLRELGLPPIGFQVQTLHGLALNIANQYPELSELNLDYSTLITPRPNHRIIRDCVEQWIDFNPTSYRNLIEGQNNFDGEESERLRRQSVLRTEVLPSLAHHIIREAKSSGLTPLDVINLNGYSKDDIYGTLEIAGGLYQQYEQLMQKNNFIDYDDMILASLRVLENREVRKMWQKQVFAVFEDEAQDSSPLQGKLINILATNSDSTTNLIRVGDPNQAINSTFTPADPVYFNLFCDLSEQRGNLATMNQAGRSTKIIVDSANFVLKWINKQFDDQHLPFRNQAIKLVSKNDPQIDANPEAEGNGLEIYTPDDIYHTVELVGDRLKDLFSQNIERNAAILVRENSQGKFLAEKLIYLQKEENIQIKLVSDFDNYAYIPREVLKILKFIDRPHSSNNLRQALEVLQEKRLITVQDIHKLSINPEQFLYPTLLDSTLTNNLQQAQQYLCDLLKARLELPHYQLILFIAMKLKYSGSELATIEKLCDRINLEIVGNSSLKIIIKTLTEIIKSERFEGVEEDNDDIYTKKGQITIMTMHKAKGLDWDYVFIPFLHQDILPGKPYIPKTAEFLGNFTLSEIARAQLRFAVHNQYKKEKFDFLPSPDEAWEEANLLKKAEEYRLLYVAMTRAKRLLWMSACDKAPFMWNMLETGGNNDLQSKIPCPVISILKRKLS